MRSHFAFVVCLFAVGCGSRSDLVPVEGQVTIDGQPVTTGQIQFYPESGRPASGTIDSEGRYELKTYEPGDGAKPGKYKVTITSRIIPEEAPAYSSFEDEMKGNMLPSAKQGQSGRNAQRTTWIVPRKYSHRSTSDLVAEVGKEAQNIDFPIKTKP